MQTYALEVGGIIFEVGERRLFDLTEVIPKRNRADILHAYVALTGNDSGAVQYSDVLNVVLRAIELAWYKAAGRTPPAIMVERFTQAKEQAKMATATKDRTEKGERLTAKSVITQGLLSGKAPDKILAEVKRLVPDSAADMTHISYYKSRLTSAGELKKEKRAAPQKTTIVRKRTKAKRKTA